MPTLKPALLLACTALTFAARLTISIPGSNLLPNPSELPASTHAVLLGPPGVRYDTSLRRDNSLVFSNLPEASYLLTVHSRDYFFPPLRVDINRTEGEGAQTIDAWQTFRGNEWNNKGPSYGSGKDELSVQIRPSGKKDFYQVRGGFSILSFLKSPMILMALVSVALIFGMPYIMDNMDPEAKAEFEEMQKKSPLTGSGASNSLQNFDLAGFLAGRSSTPAAGEGSSSGGGGKKR
ncbi:ER membrane complex subunit 7 homolog [Lecanosticta acicola]|uniref:ER membrane complex subunit 7 homolog n=1 Tax=Lecanosticta acicola TaxID=111012 RepID=A0AAI9EEV7_9PEZI|nr:ER membrane complex subunit 7 homolog [Lecanosticta acicola]